MELLLALLLAASVVALASAWSALKTERGRVHRLEDRLAVARPDATAPSSTPLPEPPPAATPPAPPAAAPRLPAPPEPAPYERAPSFESFAATLLGPAERLGDSMRAADPVLADTAARLRSPLPPSSPVLAGDDPAPPRVDVDGLGRALATAERISDERSRLADDVRSLRSALDRVAELDTGLSRGLSELARTSEALMPLASSVSGLADRANLLGLNVSLLSARAGEAGAPFEEAAAELRSLFEEARRLSRELIEAARRNEGGTRRVSALVEESVGAATAGQERGARASERLGGLEGLCSQLGRTLEEGVRSTRDAAESARLVRERLDTVRAAAEARAAEATRLRAEADAARETLRAAAERVEALRLDGGALRAAVQRVTTGA
ncbi:MAG TPA: methyl-accepting chemotaxis protein [Thermoanaerobaculia bacterium]|jgi:DNA repair exonuclease SbcCD ATPase subunit|nr:methyl-accepting chemotaxis protein [Thermoanaerobaculia bacterium]HPA50901.1 methyl-accepting chemotaxis protein [Thermoanaerobaculia bacterium]HQN06359.1 methyl-accepting chemotaxis protein [Thermoanaerobaculia bacterium]HQP86201.1 methyl-accepting chemotaxis protein [Thermoanaerobaculia bacterium]